MNERFDLVIFDNDGVLVDSEWHANGILAELLTEYGLPCTREDCIREYMGSTMTRVRAIAEARIGAALPRELEDRYHEALFEAFRTKSSAGARPMVLTFVPDGNGGVSGVRVFNILFARPRAQP